MKFASFSFGCRVNQAEKEALDRQMELRGYQFDDRSPDIFILNTCSVTHKAEREARQMINQIKARHEGVKVVVMGCAATNWIKTRTRVEGVDLLVENHSKEFIADLIDKRYRKNLNTTPKPLGQKLPKASAATGGAAAAPELKAAAAGNPHLEPAAALLEGPQAQDKYLRSGRALIKIQDGCQRFCTYCIVPYLRGLPKSIPKEQLLARINSLPASIQEVIFTAINTEAYGYDTKKDDFVDLLAYTLEHSTIPRISFGSIHPWSVDERFFNLLTTHPAANRIVKFFHIPLQSGSNKMLQLMKRGYTREEFEEKLRRLADSVPLANIGTDIIVGFLEESDADFEDTYRFLERSPISKIHVFRYSPRQHTAAYYLGKRLKEPDPQTKSARARVLAKLSRQKQEGFLRGHIGIRSAALFLENCQEELRQAVLENGTRALIAGCSKEDIGKLSPVRITALRNGVLLGEKVF